MGAPTNAPPPLPNPDWQAFRRHRAPAPHVDKFPEFVAEGMVVTIYAVAGRLLLRLSRVPRTQGKPIGLNLATHESTRVSDQ